MKAKLGARELMIPMCQKRNLERLNNECTVSDIKREYILDY